MGSQDEGRDEAAARDAHFDSPEYDLERREAAVKSREAAHAARMNAARSILAAADERDAAADARDAAAEKRENDLDRAEMLDPKSEYGAHWPERRHAALDRKHA